eukprot:gnl/MRDRNA2_/MRDRNA2_34568_c0_seq1.p1 gnl/MRDRNA2_/MRDRNA2_34568_c0~~gnl/MRDRNA2_/MRDRNA2_34568_c0_seq1.p1  ORF type:complete len:183 (-),score=31.25 gnl/MRDRNA2_/MRDRNA2_34568_c0_seq1:76-624(-)
MAHLPHHLTAECWKERVGKERKILRRVAAASLDGTVPVPAQFSHFRAEKDTAHLDALLARLKQLEDEDPKGLTNSLVQLGSGYDESSGSFSPVSPPSPRSSDLPPFSHIWQPHNKVVPHKQMNLGTAGTRIFGAETETFMNAREGQLWRESLRFASRGAQIGYPMHGTSLLGSTSGSSSFRG